MFFSQQLFGAWRAAGLVASPRPDGGITFACPKCAESRLDVADGMALCPVCSWGAEGEAWDIANSAKKIKPAEEQKSNLPPIVFGSEIATKAIETPEELITGMLHRGAKMVLGGGSKSFKTWCLADLAISIASGRQWWGREVQQGKVMYLNLEVQSAFFHQRLQAIAHAKGVSLPETLGIWNLRGHCADHRTLLPKLGELLTGQGYAAVVLDPTYKIMAGSENAQEEVAALMDSIEKLGQATGAAMIFGSHFAKGNAAGKEAIDRISGSGVFARDPDAILTMTRHEEEGVFVIDPILRNCPPVDPFCVRWEFPLMRSAPDKDVNALKQPGGWTSKKSKVPPPAEKVIEIVHTVAGKDPIWGGLNDRKGLAHIVMDCLSVTREAAQTAIEAAQNKGLELVEEPKLHGGKPKRGYRLNPDKVYVPNGHNVPNVPNVRAH